VFNGFFIRYHAGFFFSSWCLDLAITKTVGCNDFDILIIATHRGLKKIKKCAVRHFQEGIFPVLGPFLVHFDLKFTNGIFDKHKWGIDQLMRNSKPYLLRKVIVNENHPLFGYWLLRNSNCFQLIQDGDNIIFW
jgi:hypothetical protein